MTFTAAARAHYDSDRLHDMVTSAGRLVVAMTPQGLWYSDSYFAKPADEPLRLLLASRGYGLDPATFTIDTPDDPFADVDEEEWLRLPEPVDLTNVLPDPAQPTVDLEIVRFHTFPAMARYSADTTAYVFRRPDGQHVYINRTVLHWVAGSDDTDWNCRQAEDKPAGLVSFPAGQTTLRGVVMPIRPRPPRQSTDDGGEA